MDQRIDILEREVSAIKSEIAVIKLSCLAREDDARIVDGRLARIEANIAVLQANDVALKADVAALTADVAALKAAVAALKADVAALKAQVDHLSDHLATKAELKDLEVRVQGWMIKHTITIILVLSGIQFALYTALKH